MIQRHAKPGCGPYSAAVLLLAVLALFLTGVTGCHPAGATTCDHNTVTSHCTTPTPAPSP